MKRVFAMFFLSSFLSLVAAAQNVQVNRPDHNTANHDNNTTQSETSHAVSGKTIVIGYNNDAQLANGVANWSSLAGYAYSTNGGITFTDAGVLLLPAGKGLFGDPSVAVDNAGTFYLASLSGPVVPHPMDPEDCLPDPCPHTQITDIAIFRSTSTSPAVTFGEPVFVPGFLTFGTGAMPDKELIAIDRSGGQFDGRVYMAWCEFEYSSVCKWTLFTRSTTTNPLAFKPPVALPGGNQGGVNDPGQAYHTGAMPAVGPNGEVYVVWGRFPFMFVGPFGGIAYTGQTVRLLKSTDGGDTFFNPDPTDAEATKNVATPNLAVNNMVSSGIPIRTLGFPYIAVDSTPSGSSTRGNVYIVFQADPDGPGPDRSDIFFTRSSDGGAHWSTPRSINASPAVTINPDPTTNDNWQPSITISPTTGQISVSFYDRRDDKANTLISLYEAVSTDAGLTWSNKRVSDTQFRPATNYNPLFAADGYMGDYNWVVTDGNVFHFTWSDCRNTVTQPAGATNPASPPGRGDQDVFFAKRDGLSGADLFITPWGNITGIGFLWQTPDIFLVDASGGQILPLKGQINRLRARVKNLGGLPANGVKIRFKYAPAVAGTPDSIFKEIGVVSADFAPGETKEIPIDWDLTNLTETNGGIWPTPVGTFDHFCLKVYLESSDDVNLSNNIAQTNFFDVPNPIGAPPLRFLFGNPYKTQEEAQLILEPLPRGFGAEIRGSPAQLGQSFTLKPEEIKSATIVFTVPPELVQYPPTSDVVAHVSLRIRGKLVGGFSIRLARKTPKDKRAFSADYYRVFDAIVSVLKDNGEPISLADRNKGLINSGSISLEPSRLKSVVRSDLLRQIKEQSGRVLLSFQLQKLGPETTEVRVTSMIIVHSEVGNALGGFPTGSSGLLEQEHLDAIAKRLGPGK